MNKDKKPKKLWGWIKRRKWWILLFIVIAGVAVYFISGNSGNQGTGFATASITRGDLRQVVTATGEIQPLNTINVGSQVSGTIEAIYVDYNSKVKKGDVLLEIEPSVLQASVDEAYASLVSAESEIKHCMMTDSYHAQNWNNPRQHMNRRNNRLIVCNRNMIAR